jgi:septation ring formation regulator EzrA
MLPALIDATWTLYEKASAAKKGQLAGQLQRLHQELVKLTDMSLDPEQQTYKDAVSKVQKATKQVKKAQKDQAEVAKAIKQVAAVVSAIAKIVGTAMTG